MMRYAGWVLAAGCLLSLTGGVAFAEPPVMKLNAFSLAQVRLLDGRFLQEQERMHQYLLELEPDRLLYNFRVQAGLAAPGTPLGGWEAPTCEVRGHFTGHYLSACALMYAATGDEALKDRAALMVQELAKCQAALGGEYLSAFPESFWERLETGQPVWVPYYTVHKIMAGLYDVYTLMGNQQALAIMKGMASYIRKRVDRLPNDQMDRVLRVEFGGMSEVLHNLYSITQDPADLDLAHKFDQPEFLGPLALSYDNLTRIHGNTNIPKVVGAARRYELTGDIRYRDISSFFWDRVVNTRTYATGGSTMFEAWPEPDKLSGTLGHLNHETCKTYNMLRLTRHLFCWTGDTQYGDFYERALFNGILGTQGPEPGMLQYYVPMGDGFPRYFGTMDQSFWCCYGSGVESFSKLGDSLYFNDGNNLYVNLFASSSVDWTEKGIHFEQKTDFPREEGTTLTIHAAQPWTGGIFIRKPYWLAGSLEATVNGKAAATETVSEGWVAIRQTWQEGDVLVVRMPMTLHTLPLNDEPNRVAVMYGPVVLAGVVRDETGKPPFVHAHHEGITLFQIPIEPHYFVGDPAHPEEWIERTRSDALEFHPRNQTWDMKLVPFEDIVNDHYALYWPVVAGGSPQEAELAVAAEHARREVDRVFMFPHEVDATCSERQHNLQGEKTTSGAVPSKAFVYRHAEPGGWFSWDMALPETGSAELMITYWGSDDNRIFDIQIDGKTLTTVSLKPEHPGKTVDVVYPIPASLTEGKAKATIRFDANHNTMAGGIFGCAMLKAK